MGLFQGPLLCSIDLCTSLCQYHTAFTIITKHKNIKYLVNEFLHLSSLFFFKIDLAILQLLFFHIEFIVWLWRSMKNCGIMLKWYFNLQIPIFLLFCLPTHEHDALLCLLKLFIDALKIKNLHISYELLRNLIIIIFCCQFLLFATKNTDTYIYIYAPNLRCIRSSGAV